MGSEHVTRFDMCEMEYRGGAVESSLAPVCFEAGDYEQYRLLIDGCFYEMRRARDIRPHEHYCDSLDELMKKRERIFLLWNGAELVGTVSCPEGGIDSLAVSANHQRRGNGRKLMEFALSHMQRRGGGSIKLVIAKGNSAIALYESLGFVIMKEAAVEGVSTQDADGNWTFRFTETGGLPIR